MNKKLNLAVAGAVLALGATGANAGIIIPAGDWTLDIGGNVNTFYTYTKADDANVIAGGIAATNNGFDDNSTDITTGLLPNYLSVSGKTRQNDLDVGFTISIQPGSSTDTSLNQNANQENRQAFLTFGDKSWGSIKIGKDLGIFASDAILSDMTLLGVGGGAGFPAGPHTTTLGGIGSGYIYADWKSQISYWSPNWNGFSFALGVMQPWENIGGSPVNQTRSEPGFEGKVNYEWAGDFAGKVWASFITQKVEDMLLAGGATESDRANGFDIGATVNVAGFALTGYYYDGEGIGTTGFLNLGYDATGDARDSDGGYVQAVYALPGVGTKIGASWGVSKLDENAGDPGNLIDENKRWTVGVYHPLTKHLNLVAEYSDVESEAHNGIENEAKTISAGAILFF